MSEIMRARVLTFIVLVIAIELIVLGALYFYHGVQKETLETKVSSLAGQTAQQTRDQVREMLNIFEGITQQILLNPQLRKDIIGTQTGKYDGVEIKRADQRIKDELTALKFLNKNIVNIRLLSKERFEDALDIQYGVFASANSNTINIFSQNKEMMREMIQAGGESVWVGTKKNGFFYPPEMEETKYFPGYTFTLGRLLKNAANPKSEMLVVMEIQSKVLEDALKNVKIGENSSLTIVDGQQKVVLAADPKAAEQDSPYQIPEGHKTGQFYDDGMTRVIGESIGKPNWSVLLSYQTGEYTSYVESTFQFLIIVISIIVFVVSAGLAWLMNRE